jgi:hypothetical protein
MISIGMVFDIFENFILELVNFLAFFNFINLDYFILKIQKLF